MKNTVAIAIIIVGAALIYSGYKNLSIADTIRTFTGQKVDNGTDMQIAPHTPKKAKPAGTDIPGFTPNTGTTTA